MNILIALLVGLISALFCLIILIIHNIQEGIYLIIELLENQMETKTK